MKTNKLLALSLLVVTACGAPSNNSDASVDVPTTPAGSGSIAVNVWGEDYVANEIPAADVEDGWRIQFSKFYVHISNIQFGATGSTQRNTLLATGRVFDLKQAPMPLTIGVATGVEARRQDIVQFELSTTAANSIAHNISESELTMMKTNRYALYVEGTATHPMQGMYSFRWGFSTSTRFTNCQDDMGARGIVVTSGATPSNAQVTIHADHLFYDGLQNSDAKVRFNAIAGADRNMDRMISLDELAMVDLTTLPMGQYRTGSAPNVNNLRDFVTALVGTVGHFNGEGHCDEMRF
ncbi:MAG: hypothetical protein JNK05_12470 [Myxococcales bacterium]|nr:hypothetical protein [Myxococcales bacterium]